MRNWLDNVLTIVFGILFVTQSLAALEMELTQGAGEKIPIAVMPFLGAPEIDKTIANDLKNSGVFELKNTTGSNFFDWQNQKINNVISGKVKMAGGAYKISFQLLDVYNSASLLTKDYTADQSQFRTIAHRISDLVYQQLTGIKGIFSTKIAYVLVQRGTTTKYSLMITDADGQNTKRLLLSNEPIMSPVWSPDGRNLAYVSFENKRSAIYAHNIYDGNRILLSRNPGINGAPAWSHDGKKLALVLTKTDYPKIYVLDLKTNNLTPITSGYSLDTEPSWAPNDQSLLFTSDRGGSPQIYRYYFSTGKTERLTYQGNYNARGSFTSDGKKIIMLHREGNMFNIAIQDLDSGRLINLTNSGVDESPSASPNGNMVVYATYYNGQRVLGEVAIDGKIKLILPSQEGDVQEPAWSPFL